MTDRPANLEAKPKGYEVTRFNALKHGVLSHDTVLPWENESEYCTLLDGVASEHRPQGPTEEHLSSGTGRHHLAQAAVAVNRGVRPPSRARLYRFSPRHCRCPLLTLLTACQASGLSMPYWRHLRRPMKERRSLDADDETMTDAQKERKPLRVSPKSSDI
jgi:hypothetical protein